jgi:hypothetical protein
MEKFANDPETKQNLTAERFNSILDAIKERRYHGFTTNFVDFLSGVSEYTGALKFEIDEAINKDSSIEKESLKCIRNIRKAKDVVDAAHGKVFAAYDRLKKE